MQSSKALPAWPDSPIVSGSTIVSDGAVIWKIFDGIIGTEYSAGQGIVIADKIISNSGVLAVKVGDTTYLPTS